MRRADRLFDIIQILRRKKLVRARDIASELEVSERTIYRDIGDLVASGVPIEGEAGVGYMLRKGFDLPPLMFNEQEIEALVLGARIVQSWADPELAKAANNVVTKIETMIPERLRQHMIETALLAPADHHQEPLSIDQVAVRNAIRSRQKIHMNYQDAKGDLTERTVRPLGLAFYGPVWLLVGWCELRLDFRPFRLDRVQALKVLDETFNPEPGRTIQDYLQVRESLS